MTIRLLQVQISRGLVCAAALVAMSCAAPAAPAPTEPAVPAAPAQCAPPTAGGQPAAPTALPVPQTVRYTGQSSASDAGIFIAMERGYFQEQGVRFEYVHLASGSEMVPLLAN